MDYPDRLIRGIPNKSAYIDEEGSLRATLFNEFKQVDDCSNYEELSISWLDDEKVLPLLLHLKSTDNDELRYKGGVAMLLRDEVDSLIKWPAVKEYLSYQRAPTPENKYHGNLLLKKGISKERKRMIASALALSATVVAVE